MRWWYRYHSNNRKVFFLYTLPIGLLILIAKILISTIFFKYKFKVFLVIFIISLLLLSYFQKKKPGPDEKVGQLLTLIPLGGSLIGMVEIFFQPQETLYFSLITLAGPICFILMKEIGIKLDWWQDW